jgi:hypothetical protein
MELEGMGSKYPVRYAEVGVMTLGPSMPLAAPHGNDLPFFEEAKFCGKVLRELTMGGANVIRPWGVEFADSSAFYSLEDGFGYRYDLLEHRERTEGTRHEIAQVIRMKEGLVRLELDECLETPRSFRRSCRLICLEATVLMDFVLRFRFEASLFPFGSIAGRTFAYAGSCVYHQYPVDSAAVGNDRFSIRISVVGKTIPSSMGGNVYLRDGEGAWVLHVRMLPVAWEKEVVKLCSKWFGTRPLPQWATSYLLRVPQIREALWYRGEQRPWRNRIACIFSPNAYPMAFLQKGEVLMWDVSCQIRDTTVARK